jgi:hypothetical protein
VKTILIGCLIPLLTLPTGSLGLQQHSEPVRRLETKGYERTLAERRADAYRIQYEFCGPHHNCLNQTGSGSKNNPGTLESRQKTDPSMRPILHPAMRF